jgi:hypothetical protein
VQKVKYKKDINDKGEAVKMTNLCMTEVLEEVAKRMGQRHI